MILSLRVISLILPMRVYFVQDGFAVTHRAHASTDAIAKSPPRRRRRPRRKRSYYAPKAIQAPDHPFTVIIGGAKVSDKTTSYSKSLHLWLTKSLLVVKLRLMVMRLKAPISTLPKTLMKILMAQGLTLDQFLL